MVSLISNPSRSSDEIELISDEVSHLLDISPDPSILVSNTDLEILAVNASAAELTGYTRKELLSLHLDTLLPKLLSITQDPAQNLELLSIKGRELDLITRRKLKITTLVQANTLGKS
ncbi:MAG: PAS domain-containing protein, partial [Anaerolineales bacterium]|nr:PAS domain-containing protein [Anaerolineales bacterium]